MKKLLSLFLAVVMIMGLTTTALANTTTNMDADSEELIRLIKYDYLTKEESIVEIPNISTLNNVDFNTASYSPKETRVVIDDDNRYKITNTTSSPYYGIVFLKMVHENGDSYTGTGYMVSSNTLLTAGHNLYEPGNPIKTITAYPGRNGSSYNISSTAKTHYIDEKYTGSGYTWDYGIVVLNSNLGNTTGWLGLHAAGTASSLNGKSISVTGYPGDKPYATMWKDNGTISSASTYTFKHNADTYRGHSGSPVYFYSTTYGYQSTGIHVSGKIGSHNTARRITVTLFNWLEDQGYIS